MQLDIQFYHLSFAIAMPTNLLSSLIQSPPAELFGRFAGETGAAWLDSSLQIGDRGRFSILARQPRHVLRMDTGGSTYLDSELLNGNGDLRSFLRELSAMTEDGSMIAIGYISYEATLSLLGVTPVIVDKTIPAAQFYLYAAAIRYDHRLAEYDCINGDLDKEIDSLPDNGRANHQSSGTKCGEARHDLTCDDYLKRVAKIKSHIKEGDIYQANFTTRLRVFANGPPFETYLALRRLNPAAYSAYINGGHFQILSSSPERMFLRDAGAITTGPIKGTIPTGNSPEEIARNRHVLLESKKDRAELLMIVDLLRNDLGKIAATGSVSVDRLHGVEVYSSVIHLVGDVSCRLKANVGFEEVCSALLPGGSITGAPKKRATEVIQSLENEPRSVYTGCIGYVHGDRADFNIAIRTMVFNNCEYSIHAGGGIVADSLLADEYAEMLLKAKNLIKAVEECHQPGVKQKH